jgi:hypothetical protein
VPYLIRAYTDSDPGVRQNVINALQTIGTPEALDFLSQTQLPAIRTSNHRLVRFARLARHGAWLLIVGGVLAGLTALGVSFEYGGAGAYLGLSTVVGLGSGFLLRILSETIYAIIDIEANTRRSAHAAERLLDLQISSDESSLSSDVETTEQST